MRQGGLITGPGIPAVITTIRVVEPGLSVVSIDGGRPEYLISQDWVREHPAQVPVGVPPEAWTRTATLRKPTMTPPNPPATGEMTRIVNDAVSWDDRKEAADVFQSAGGRLVDLSDNTYEGLLAVAQWGARRVIDYADDGLSLPPEPVAKRSPNTETLAPTRQPTITEFLLARIAEDEIVAESAIPSSRPGRHWRWQDAYRDRNARLDGEHEVVSLRSVEEFPTVAGPLPAFVVSSAEVESPEQAAAYRHIARWDPARVLAECSAKRVIIKEHQLTPYIVQSDEEDDRGSSYCIRCFEHAGLDRVTPACPTIRALASIYTNHPAYQPIWAL